MSRATAPAAAQSDDNLSRRGTTGRRTAPAISGHLCLLIGVAGIMPTPGAAQVQDVPPVELVIGVLDEPAPGHRVLGTVLDIDVDAYGNIFTIDEEYASVRAFGAEGRVLGVAWRNGAGPGELRRPLRAAIDSAGRVHVLDAGNSRITIYELEPAGKGLRYVSDSRITIPATDICILGPRRYLLSRQGALIREIDSEGRTVREFGERIKADGEFARAFNGVDTYLNYGKLLCHTEAQAVILVHRDFGVLRRFSPDGATQWTGRVLDWRQQQYERNEAGRCCNYNIPDPKSGTFNYVTAIAANGPGEFVIALAEVRPGAREYSYALRVHSVSNGEEVARWRSGLMAESVKIMAIAGGEMYGYSYRPFPQVRVFRRPEGGESY